MEFKTIIDMYNTGYSLDFIILKELSALHVTDRKATRKVATANVYNSIYNHLMEVKHNGKQ